MLLAAAGYRVDNHTSLQSVVSRMLRVKHQMHAAGTRADYEAAKTALETATDDLASTAPEVRAEIEKLQRRLAGLESAVADGTRRVEGMEVARAALRSPSLLPPFVVTNFNADERHECGHWTQRVAQLESRLALIGEIAGLEPGSQQARNYASSLGGLDGIRTSGLVDDRGRIARGLWDAHVQKLQAERPAIEAELAEARQQLASITASRAEHLEFYIKQLG
jgi:prefoldin subunit 5